MARAITENFHEFVLEIETETPGTYAALCGLTSRGINRTSNMSTSEVPDCENEALPAAVERAVQSQEVTVSGSGVWAQTSHELMLDWWYSGATKNVRIKNTKAAVGDTEIEAGAAYLVSISNQAERGQKVTAEISVEFDGIPTRTAKAA
ncbi:phage tail protein [Phyllobacterium sp. A18/5-2]|uniref:phage tail protein n=1 Tax=Phyllobacterium sp. A18/5-2 TaxID=2978392 RepID=UPI0021C89CB5|nr:phage tail protein [Phyllobacterium sp. A18/5-2]UXN62907.1 phage tail protein [Phyllobacterium sp. A18/5-2]